jgi:DNA-binding transcriptional MocR family regulator
VNIDTRFFRGDDYSEVNARYFADLRSSGLVDADPSGWLFTQSHAARLLHVPLIRPSDLVQYRIDEGSALGEAKERVRILLSAWEQRKIPLDEFTVCPSGGTASLVTLATLKSVGVSRVLFETPAYFGTIEQAEALGIQVDLVPTYRRDGYSLPELSPRIGLDSVAVWLTQPRASLGFDQPRELMLRILSSLTPNQYLVVDEVTDQSFPAHLRGVYDVADSRNLLRIRSFTKGMGLNGLRLAVILHSDSMRSSIVDCLESLGGSVDAHSLLIVGSFANDVPRFKAMLEAANRQVNSLRRIAEQAAAGTPLYVNPLTNGYIGTMVADLTRLGQTEEERRTALLVGCEARRTPIMLGSTFFVAKDPPTEAIRLNFLSYPDHIMKGIKNVAAVLLMG